MMSVQNLVQKKTGLKIDQPDPRGGTTSTGGVARRAFSDDTEFIECILPLIFDTFESLFVMFSIALESHHDNNL